MSRRRRFLPALLLTCLCCAGCIAPGARQIAPARAPSLIYGQWKSFSFLGQPGCNPDDICLNVMVDARIAYAHTLSGPEIPSPLTVRLWIHSDPWPGSSVIMAVGRDPAEGKWTGNLVHIVRPGREACLHLERLAELGVDIPAGRRTRDKRICVPVPIDQG